MYKILFLITKFCKRRMQPCWLGERREVLGVFIYFIGDKIFVGRPIYSYQ